MSSTNFNVGFNDGRSSSRVLKPPGGGHSDIFGIHEEEKVRPKARQQNCQIMDCFKMDESDGVQKKKPEPVPVPVPEKKTEEETENNAPPTPEENGKPAPASQPQRVRVPPGGFSSGFW